jgi:EAL domain-containing protein (putative c-di-GMP-specific phosphodiesterase class I)
VNQNRSQKRSLKRLLNVLASLGSEAIAEGIETKEEFEILQEMNVQYAQGFYFGNPSQLVSV